MTHRERLQRAMRRTGPDRVPKWLSLSAALQEDFERRTGSKDVQEYFDLEMRTVRCAPTERTTDFSPYIGDLAKGRSFKHSYGGSSVDEWGIGYTEGSMYHYTKRVHPMQRLESPSEIQRYPWPDAGEVYRFRPVEQGVRELHQKGYAAMAYEESTIFELSWHLRGFEELMVDMVARPELATAIMDPVTDIRCAQAARFASAGADLLSLGDDIGTQHGPVMSPAMWREWLKPRLAAVVKSARSASPDVLISYHSDGKVDAFIEDLVAIGIDILNPVQPECMDPVEIKKTYGDRLSFWGTIGTQTTMPFGRPEEVRVEVKRMIETVGKGGGLLIAPTHRLQAEVPWENILAFVRAVDEFGVY